MQSLLISASARLRGLKTGLFLLACWAAPAARGQDVALKFEGCPGEIVGQAGETRTFDVFATVTTSNNPTSDGAQAWQLSLTADGGTIKAIAVNGLTVSTIYDHDGLPETAPLNPYQFDLANASFRNAQLATFPADGRKGAVSQVLLGQEQKTVLQPNGTARIAKITLEVKVPAGTVPSAVTLRYENGFKGTGLAIKNWVTFDGINFPPALGSCTIPVKPLPAFAFNFEGCPGAVVGLPGEVKTFEVYSLLTTDHNVIPDGAQAWQLSLTADGGTIKAIAVNGLTVSTIYDHDGLPETAPLNPYQLDLANASFRNAQLATFPADGRKGAVSQVLLGQEQKTVLQPNGTVRIAKITLEVKVPTGDVPAAVTLRYESGFKGSGLAIKNLVTLDGINYLPALGSCTIPVSPLPTFAFNFEGCPSVVTGQAGEVKTFDLYATLSTSHNTSPDGAQAWQVSVTADGGRIKAIAVDGITVPTIYDHDGLPGTAPLNPFQLDLANADFKVSQLATFPADGRKGAVSAVYMGQEKKNVLLPNGTVRIAKITVEATIPSGTVTAPLTLRFENGFKGTGLPLKNLVTIDGVNFQPSLFECSTVLSPLPTVSLGFEGCPSRVSGQPGEVRTFDVLATLTTSTNASPNGAQAWQLSLTADGGRIKALTVDGLQVSAIFDHDGLPQTPPLNPHPLDLADASFKVAQLATFPADGRKGAVSAVLLGQELETVLLPNAKSGIARITVEATLPAAGTGQVTLRFEDGFKGSGLPTKNLVTLDGINFRPALGSCTVDLEASTVPANQLPGDCNQDRVLDISDGICLLGFLFTGATERLPCGDGSSGDPGNLALMNANGDPALDLSDAISLFGYLFLDGSPHVLGESCAGIAGCPSSCQ